MTRRELIDKYRRDAKDDIDWITVSGNHVPLKDGVAVGGYYKGKKFLRAESVKKGGTRKTTKVEKSRTVTKKSVISEAHLRFKERLKGYDERVSKAEQDIKKIDDDIQELRHLSFIYDVDEKKIDGVMWDREYLEEAKISRRMHLNTARKMLKMEENPPKKGDKNYSKWHGQLKLYGIASKSKNERIEFLEKEIERSRSSKDIDNQLAILDEYEKNGTFELSKKLKSEVDKSRSEKESKRVKLEESIKKNEESRKAAVNSRLKKLDNCKDAEDLKEYILNSGLFRVNKTVKDPLLGYYDIPDIDSRTSVEKFDFGASKEVVRNVEIFFERYPKLKGMFKPIDFYRGEGETKADKAMGMCGAGGKVHVNMKYWQNPDLFRKKLSEANRKRYLSTSTPYGTVVHEYGHAINNLLSRGSDLKFSYDVLKKCMNKFGRNERDCELMQCKYAEGDDEEFVAEAFAEYVCSDRPRKIAQYVGKLMEEEMRKQGYI